MSIGLLIVNPLLQQCTGEISYGSWQELVLGQYSFGTLTHYKLMQPCTKNNH